MDLLERAEFFEQLQGTLAEVMCGHGRVALVTGEAGIGKTSLIEQFAERLSPTAELGERSQSSLCYGAVIKIRTALPRKFLSFIPGFSPVQDWRMSEETVSTVCRYLVRKTVKTVTQKTTCATPG